ncbi:MAG TPA: disulfide bond formation protein DsbA, partial [Dehalococcoidia bacterium]|nr:disulfide bond formation protein DsbA [Dehalococcoidia bacterium]
YSQQVLDEYQVARDQGVTGTPTYLIDGELMPGDVSLDDLIAAVKKAS